LSCWLAVGVAAAFAFSCFLSDACRNWQRSLNSCRGGAGGKLTAGKAGGGCRKTGFSKCQGKHSSSSVV